MSASTVSATSKSTASGTWEQTRRTARRGPHRGKWRSASVRWPSCSRSARRSPPGESSSTKYARTASCRRCAASVGAVKRSYPGLGHLSARLVNETGVMLAEVSDGTSPESRSATANTPDLRSAAAARSRNYATEYGEIRPPNRLKHPRAACRTISASIYRHLHVRAARPKSLKPPAVAELVNKPPADNPG